MGTRADFYVGREFGKMKWIGSIAWDGYPDGIDETILKATDAKTFRREVDKFLKRSDGTLPKDGWPWPWKDSRTTDYAYCYEKGKVLASCFGGAWFDPMKEEAPEEPFFPDMSKLANVAIPGSPRSGLVCISIDEKH